MIARRLTACAEPCLKWQVRPRFGLLCVSYGTGKSSPLPPTTDLNSVACIGKKEKKMAVSTREDLLEALHLAMSVIENLGNYLNDTDLVSDMDESVTETVNDHIARIKLILQRAQEQ